jgi:hypothetical protein
MQHIGHEAEQEFLRVRKRFSFSSKSVDERLHPGCRASRISIGHLRPYEGTEFEIRPIRASAPRRRGTLLLLQDLLRPSGVALLGEGYRCAGPRARQGDSPAIDPGSSTRSGWGTGRSSRGLSCAPATPRRDRRNPGRTRTRSSASGPAPTPSGPDRRPDRSGPDRDPRRVRYPAHRWRRSPSRDLATSPIAGVGVARKKPNSIIMLASEWTGEVTSRSGTASGPLPSKMPPG